MNQMQGAPSKQRDDRSESPVPEENLTDDSLEMNKHIPNEVAPRNSGLIQSEQDGPSDFKDPRQRRASGMAQRDQVANPQFSN